MNTVGVIDFITGWLKEYSETSRTKGFVVGVSGGIDSAVTSALAAKTGLPTLLVEIPIHQSKNQVSRARKHIEYLSEEYDNVNSVEVELTNVFDDFVNKTHIEGVDKEMALVNTRARLRMTTLYYYATLYGYLVVGTGNKIEDFGVGFFTKYGDGGVDLSPIADLYKSEVYDLGKELGVNNAILDAPPTDGLWGDDRTDEDQLGASYDELEWAMERQKEGKLVSDFTGREAEVYSIYIRLNKANTHKMVPIPVCGIPEILKN